MDEDRITGPTYAPGKWTLKEVVGQLADDERIFAYRALRIARANDRPLPRFDENVYVEAAGFEQRTLEDLLGEFHIAGHELRRLRSLKEEYLPRIP